MTKPTMLDAEEAAEKLGVSVYELGFQLRDAAYHAVLRAAEDVRKGHSLDVGRARRLLWAAEAAEAAEEAVAAVQEEVPA